MDDDLVEITCYGQKQEMTRKKAIEEFSIAAECCEGHERERYAYILCRLLHGDVIIDDSDV